jgi:aminocarboxymuconate-semialdehyde decarboxylase
LILKMTSTASEIRLDIHAHLIPITESSRLPLPGLRWDSASKALEVDGNLLSTQALYQPSALISWMDANNVDHAWFSIPPTLYRQDQDENATRSWIMLVNDGLHDIAENYPERLDALFHLPIRHPLLALETAADLMAAGKRRYAMPAGSAAHGVTLSDPAYEPLWQELAREKTFLFIHPGRCCDSRLSRFSLQNLVGNPTETTIAAAHLAMAGIVERYPNITFCLAHGGGTIAALAGRLQRGRDTRRAGIDEHVETPRIALRRFCVDCITHDPAALDLVVATFGKDRVLFGSDWPFSMGLQNPTEALSTLDDSTRQMIASDNAKKLLGMLEDA